MRSASPALRPRQVLRRATVPAVSAGLTYPAAERPADLTIPASRSAGTARTRGTSTVTVTGTPASGAAATGFVWAVSPPPGP